MVGLSTKQAEQLIEQFGLNVISEQKKKSILIKLVEQFKDFLTVLLLLAALLSFFIGESIDGGLIMAIVVLNAFFGLYQEAKAEEAIGALKKMTVMKVRVIRDGQEKEIDSRYLVAGDIVFIEEGVKIPADGKIIEQMNLEINESVLTGESLSVAKKINDEIFMGTLVAKGRGHFEITATGMKTKFGQIAGHLGEIQDTETPLQKKLGDLSRTIGIAGIVISIIVFVISMLQGLNYFPAFLLAISLAVAVVPEGLPAVMTITLSIGVKAMAKKKAIIRKLSAIEALGSITLIATDKTGTLTTNQMTVKDVYIDNKIYDEKSTPSLSNQSFHKLILNGVLCSTASLVYVHDHGHFDVLGDPTEGALLFLSQKVGLKPEDLRQDWKIINEIPFDSVTKRMTVEVQKKNESYIFSKGAPESILEISDRILINGIEETMSEINKKNIENIMSSWAKKGLRVLAFAYKTYSGANSKSPVDAKQIFLGMVAIYDAPRPEVTDAIKRAQTAGIKTIMITGDNEKTAEAIGVNVGLIKQGDEFLTGKQLEEYSDDELKKILPRVKVFARTSPFHKHRIVKLYQELGEIVAVTGDGVNDAIALKQADVGVAMGLVGTDVARETADMVITDDNFATIVNAIDEGRNIIKNIKNAVKYLLSCNMSEALALIIGLIIGLPHLFYAIQLLYINLVTDGVPALALAFSPRDDNAMKKPPEKKLQLLKDFDQRYILAVGILSTILILTAYFVFRIKGDVIGKTAAFSVLTLIQSFILIDLWLSHRSLRKHKHQLISPMFLIAFCFPFLTQFVIVKTPWFAKLFRIQPVSLAEYLYFIVISFLILIGIKGVKGLWLKSSTSE